MIHVSVVSVILYSGHVLCLLTASVKLQSLVASAASISKLQFVSEAKFSFGQHVLINKYPKFYKIKGYCMVLPQHPPQDFVAETPRPPTARLRTTEWDDAGHLRVEKTDDAAVGCHGKQLPVTARWASLTPWMAWPTLPEAGGVARKKAKSWRWKTWDRIFWMWHPPLWFRLDICIEDLGKIPKHFFYIGMMRWSSSKPIPRGPVGPAQALVTSWGSQADSDRRCRFELQRCRGVNLGNAGLTEREELKDFIYALVTGKAAVGDPLWPKIGDLERNDPYNSIPRTKMRYANMIICNYDNYDKYVHPCTAIDRNRSQTYWKTCTRRQLFVGCSFSANDDPTIWKNGAFHSQGDTGSCQLQFHCWALYSWEAQASKC